jgi:hypothetical protein
MISGMADPVGPVGPVGPVAGSSLLFIIRYASNEELEQATHPSIRKGAYFRAIFYINSILYFYMVENTM